MSEASIGTVRGRLSALLAFATTAEPRRPPASGRAIGFDVVLAVAFAGGSFYAVRLGTIGMLAALLVCGSLAVRRVFPLTAFLVIVAVALAVRGYATYYTFVAIVIAAYSAVVHSRYRGASLLAMVPAGLLIAAGFWNSQSHVRGVGDMAGVGGAAGVTVGIPRSKIIQNVTVFPGHFGQLSVGAPWRVVGLLVLVSLASIAIVGVALYTADRIRSLKAEHEEATRRAVEVERARIASDLHDVVTHNVSVMIVQAGAARQVLAQNPANAREALLAVESSGRAAMTELRSLLGLLSPTGSADQREDLRPQPGLGQLDSLIGRVTAAGLPVEFSAAGIPEGLPPGIDLAAYRVIQEGLTNVIKHAGKPATRVSIDYRGGDLVVEVADAGRRIPAAGPVSQGDGRGLLGLHERIAIYGGELTAGPQPSGGWLVRARIPADPVTGPIAEDLTAAPR
jgi:signal transduction histidine kinase